ncbi:MAG: PQQ-binding-like beta-propeller repeat protein, partial [Candidatus Omnitrophica bacterium]|nr:PQQ-binding-like beta-propeller repeat protein [Candidatus Omnitrophota bacterium]
MKNTSSNYHSGCRIEDTKAVSLGLPVVLVLLFLVSFKTAAEENEWCRFRGPNGTGLSDATTVPVQWTEKDYNWKVKLPGVGHSSPVLWGRRIYLTSGETETAERTVLCLDATDGHTIWQHDYASKPFHMNRDNSYATATPSADANGVVVNWSTPDDVVLLALDTE